MPHSKWLEKPQGTVRCICGWEGSADSLVAVADPNISFDGTEGDPCSYYCPEGAKE